MCQYVNMYQCCQQKHFGLWAWLHWTSCCQHHARIWSLNDLRLSWAHGRSFNRFMWHNSCKNLGCKLYVILLASGNILLSWQRTKLASAQDGTGLTVNAKTLALTLLLTCLFPPPMSGGSSSGAGLSWLLLVAKQKSGDFELIPTGCKMHQNAIPPKKTARPHDFTYDLNYR